MIGSIFVFFLKLINSDSGESSKRFLAIYGTLFLMTYVVLAFTNDKNAEFILAELIGFVLVLCGVAAWERIKRTK